MKSSLLILTVLLIPSALFSQDTSWTEIEHEYLVMKDLKYEFRKNVTKTLMGQSSLIHFELIRKSADKKYIKTKPHESYLYSMDPDNGLLVATDKIIIDSILVKDYLGELTKENAKKISLDYFMWVTGVDTETPVFDYNILIVSESKFIKFNSCADIKGEFEYEISRLVAGDYIVIRDIVSPKVPYISLLDDITAYWKIKNTTR